MKRAPLLVVLAIVAVAVALPVLAMMAPPAPAATAPTGAVAGASAGTSAPYVTVPAPSDAVPSGDPAASSDPPATPAAITDVAIVPVVSFRSAIDDAEPADARGALAGTSGRYSGLVVVKSEADAILAGLSLAKADRSKLVTVKDAAALAAKLAKSRGLLGFLRADAVGPSVRALAWKGQSLFGVARVKRAAAWPLTARLPGAAHPFDPAKLWTLAAAGDVMLDRGVYREVILRGRGVDFPFAGGKATITGHRCCTSMGWPIPLTRRLGSAGAVKSITKGADLAFANHEGPTPANPRYHTQGTVFNFDARLEAGLSRAGFDWVSLANNHIGDAGNRGVVQTTAALRKAGIRFGGAGADEAAARKPSLLNVGGIKVAVLGRDAIARVYWAHPGDPGSAGLDRAKVVADIKAAKKAGADLVIVYPHWGIEYHAGPTAGQVALGHAMIDAGADLIIGNHVHWAAAMEVYKGKPIWYGLGNFVFDQTWSEQTQEGLLLELTFSGRKLVQARIHPLLLLDSAQPNLVDAAGSGKVVMRQVFNASKHLPW